MYRPLKSGANRGLEASSCTKNIFLRQEGTWKRWKLRLRRRNHMMTRRAGEARDITLNSSKVNIWRELRVPEELTRKR